MRQSTGHDASDASDAARFGKMSIRDDLVGVDPVHQLDADQYETGERHPRLYWLLRRVGRLAPPFELLAHRVTGRTPLP
jgi:hypothetical protein